MDVAEAEKLVMAHFSGIPAAKGTVAEVDTTVPPHKDTLINMATDPEAQGWSVSVEFKHKATEDGTVRNYRKNLAESLLSQMFSLRLSDLSRRPNAPFIGAQAGSSRTPGCTRSAGIAPARSPRCRRPGSPRPTR